MPLHPDFKDLLAAFAGSGVRYLLVLGYAVGFHSRRRFTKEIDLWLDDDPENVARAKSALQAFGAPLVVIEELDQANPDEIIWMGAPPVRVDLMKQIPGLESGSAYARRVEVLWEEVPVSIISLDDLIQTKKAKGRPQDLIDLAALERIRQKYPKGRTALARNTATN